MNVDLARFRSPPAAYRGTPLWSWNTHLDEAQLLRQIGYFQQMGLGGFIIHPRTGLATPYLGEDYLRLVRVCVEEAARQGLSVWLYDEDRWPSGFAGGLVTQEPQFRAKHLLFTPTPYSGLIESPALISNAKASRNENGVLLARYAVTLDASGHLAAYRRLAETEPGEREHGERVWYAYLESAVPSPWWNNQTYVDTLDKAAIERFISVTHERYAAAVGDHFGATIPAIFTDEPQFTHKVGLACASDTTDVFLPWTTDFAQTYQQVYGHDLLDALPELVWELPRAGAGYEGARPSLARYRYHDHLCERFTSAYADTLGAWSEAHNLLLTGHMMEEPTLESQTSALGEAMRAYRSFSLPGIDLLCDRREYTTAKQTQSAAHQYGRQGMLSELYGVTDWDFPFAGHKAQGDWQAALGVTQRVHHLAWVSMAGEAKRDYPASIFYQSPWWREYPLVEDHFARLNTALTRGEPVVRIGVLHPIESYWLCFGPRDQTGEERAERERAFGEVTEWLLFGLLDFDFIAESLLPDLCPLDALPDALPARESYSYEAEHAQNGEDAAYAPQLPVGRMRYDVVLVPSLRTIRSSTLERLEAFVAAGGQVLFAGEVPSLVDAQPSARAERLAARCPTLPWTRRALLDALAPVRTLDVRLPDGTRAATVLSQVRQESSGERVVFLCNTDREQGWDGAEIRLAGAWEVTLLDTLSGQTRPLPAVSRAESGELGQTPVTCVSWDIAVQGSLFLSCAALDAQRAATNAATGAPQQERHDRREGQRAKPSLRGADAPPPLLADASGAAGERWPELARLADPVPVTLSEPNVLLLDRAAFQLDDAPWEPEDEILRLDNRLRARLGWPLRMDALAQPWIEPPPPAEHTLRLRCAFQADCAIPAPRLALEAAQDASVLLDGRPIPTQPDGWWVDEAITTVPLPALEPGAHELLVTLPYGRRTNPEWMYLLGDFGVTLHGRHARLGEPVRALAFGDWTRQGLPFYAGNVTYHCAFTPDTRLLSDAGQEGEGGEGDEGQEGVKARRLWLRAAHFRAPLLTVTLNGTALGAIAFPPYELELGARAPDRQLSQPLDLTAYGNRFNAFGRVHDARAGAAWAGPDAWRTTGDGWADEYQLKPMGILVAPQLVLKASVD